MQVYVVAAVLHVSTVRGHPDGRASTYPAAAAYRRRAFEWFHAVAGDLSR